MASTSPCFQPCTMATNTMTSHHGPFITLSDVTLVSLDRVMHCTQDPAHLKAHSFRAVVILSPSGGLQSVVVEVQRWLTRLAFTLQCPFKASRWGNRELHTLGGQKEETTFSAANCVVNYAVLGIFQLPLCPCHALSSNTRASFQLMPVLKV